MPWNNRERLTDEPFRVQVRRNGKLVGDPRGMVAEDEADAWRLARIYNFAQAGIESRVIYP